MSLFTKEIKDAKDWGLLILRVVFCVVLLYGHGFGKLQTIFSGQEIQFMDPIGIGPKLSFYLATLAEGVCAILLLLGYLGRLPAIILSLNFSVIFIFHAFIAGDGFPVLEMRYLYLAGFVVLAIMGVGKFSVDYYLAKTK